jgi:Mrp family chromosome partitioning ATPase
MSHYVELLKRARQDGGLFTPRPSLPREASDARDTLPLGRPKNDYWQQLVHELFVRCDPAGRGVVGLASATAGEGTSYVAAHLASELARTLERPALLLEANIYRPSQAERHGVEPEPGLRRMLAERDFVLEQALRQTGQDNLWLLPAGARAAITPPDWTSFPLWLARLRERFAAVVVDLPPANLSTDVLILGPRLDGLVLVVEADLCSREVIQSAAVRLRRANPNLLGTVLNKRKFVIPEALYRRL